MTRKSKVNTGDMFETNNYGKIEILDYVDTRHRLVKFIDTGHIQKINTFCIVNGSSVDRSVKKSGLSLFLETSKKMHGDTYDYSEVDYQHSQTPITIICKTHGEWSTTPAVHTMGSGCPPCAYAIVGKKKSIPENKFLEMADSKFQDKYDYSQLGYVSLCKPANIICRKHGIFRQKPSEHLRGVVCCKGCLGKIHNLSSFIERSKSIHTDNKYDYSQVEYRGTKTKVSIVCPNHGIFEQTPHNHTAGKHGCPSCGKCGYDMKLKSSLYVLELGDITKIGVTNRSAKIRLKHIKANSGRKFDLLKEYGGIDGKICWNIETKLLKELSEKYKSLDDKFDGSTECFYDVDRVWLLNRIEEIFKGDL